MDQSELLELARAAMQKKRGGRKRGAARALARGAPPTPAPPPRESRTAEVDSALARIAAVDARVASHVLNEGAEESIREAEERALSTTSVFEADRRISAMDKHIADEHGFKAYNPSTVTPGDAGRMPGRIRDAFKFHLLMSKPKGLE